MAGQAGNDEAANTFAAELEPWTRIGVGAFSLPSLARVHKGDTVPAGGEMAGVLVDHLERADRPWRGSWQHERDPQRPW